MDTGRTGPIGIVSGLGPLAGADVLNRALRHAAEIYGATTDEEYPDIVVFSHGIAAFDAAGNANDRFAAELVDVVAAIELHHPAVLGIASASAHVHLDAIRAGTQAEVVNLVEETARAAAAYDRRYVLLSSSTTRETGLFHEQLDQYRVQYFDVAPSEQLVLDRVVHLVKADELDVAAEQINDLVHAIGAPFSGIIAASTELPIAFEHAPSAGHVPIVDASGVLARALVDTYYELVELDVEAGRRIRRHGARVVP